MTTSELLTRMRAQAQEHAWDRFSAILRACGVGVGTDPEAWENAYRQFRDSLHN